MVSERKQQIDLRLVTKQLRLELYEMTNLCQQSFATWKETFVKIWPRVI